MPERPSLDADLTADVCVIGGGFTGINTAIELAQRGLSVVVAGGPAHRLGRQRAQWRAIDSRDRPRCVGVRQVCGRGGRGYYLQRAGIDSVALVGERIREHGN